MKALLGLGGNLGDAADTLHHALAALEAVPHTRVLRCSSFYRTAPVGNTDQPDFVNAVAEVETALPPHALLGVCFGIEAACGRHRSFANAPRTLDMDVLLLDGLTASDEQLTVPHPRMTQRAFVLVPLAELYPSGQVYGYDLRAAMAAVGTQGVQRMDAATEIGSL